MTTDSKAPFLTDVSFEGRHFTIATLRRRLDPEQFASVCARWSGAHDAIVKPNEALFVNLCRGLDRIWPDDGPAPFSVMRPRDDFGEWFEAFEIHSRSREERRQYTYAL